MRAVLIKTLLLFVPLLLPGKGAGVDIPLKFLISIEQQSIPAPFPARITLHLHNVGNETVWLYRHARSKLPTPRPLEEDAGPQTTGGSMLTVKLEPASAGQAAIMNPGQGEVLESVGLPKPKLVRLSPLEDYEEKTTIRLTPALSQEQKPIWGTYRLSLTYTAQYSNAEAIQRNLKLTVWQGEVSSEAIEIQLQPPSPDSRGQVSGKVTTHDSFPIRDAIVSLADHAERLVAQTTSDPDGQYSFSNLPPDLYWITAHRAGATEDTVVFRHVQLTPSEASATQQMVLIPAEIYQAQKMLHKPVLFHITDNAGRAAEQVGLEVTWSNGTMVENVKGETGSDGAVALEVIPGRNFVTLKRHGCPKQEERADVAIGEGIDGFEYTLECAKK